MEYGCCRGNVSESKTFQVLPSLEEKPVKVLIVPSIESSFSSLSQTGAVTPNVLTPAWAFPPGLLRFPNCTPCPFVMLMNA